MNAPKTTPENYAHIRTGELRPDDLIWLWPSKEWIRADSPEWKYKVEIRDCVCVVRRVEREI